jgi:hypothetical protein
MSTKLPRGAKILPGSLSLILIEPIAARLGSLADFGYQRSEEFLGQAVHHTLDQTGPKLRELSTNLGLYFIGQHSAVSISLEMDTRTALGKAGYPLNLRPEFDSRCWDRSRSIQLFR